MIWKLSERKDWNSLEQQFGWVRDMNQVPQHTVHHAEGSVLYILAWCSKHCCDNLPI